MNTINSKEAFRQILVLFMAMILIGMLANLLSIGYWHLFGHSSEMMMSGESLDKAARFHFRAGLMVNHVGMFLIPALLFGIIYHRHDFIGFLRLKQVKRFWTILLWSVVILFSYPLVAYLTKMNESLPIPEWASSVQSEAYSILNNVLNMTSVPELITTIFLVGVLPAIGEELVFRGIVQQKLMRVFKSDHYGILLASILFGAIHLQLERLLPLTFLGLLLGYSFYYTKTLLVPIILHFLINTSQVGVMYFIKDFDISAIEETPDIPIITVLGSLILTFAAFYYAREYSSSTEVRA